MSPVTRYAKSGDVHIAYQVFGEGPDLIAAPGFVSHIDVSWDEPRLGNFTANSAASVGWFSSTSAARGFPTTWGTCPAWTSEWMTCAP